MTRPPYVSRTLTFNNVVNGLIFKFGSQIEICFQEGFRISGARIVRKVVALLSEILNPPLYRASQTHPLYRASQTHPLYRASQTHPLYRASQTHPLYRASQTHLLYRASQTHPLYRASQTHPLYRASQTHPLYRASQTHPLYRASQTHKKLCIFQSVIFSLISEIQQRQTYNWIAILWSISLHYNIRIIHLHDLVIITLQPFAHS